jgi:putative molybdopterin biosynthesis protein
MWHQLGIGPEHITGYGQELRTHSEVARMIAEGQADVGLGVETVALAYGLTFIPLTLERYDLVIPADVWEVPAIQALTGWLGSGEAEEAVLSLGGYDVREMGQVAWVE